MYEADKSLTLFSLIMALVTLLLIMVDESRPDAYIAVTIILYFIYTAVDPTLRRRANLRILDIVLISAFMVIVTVRVLMVLDII